MKKFLVFLLTCALMLPLMASCMKKEAGNKDPGKPANYDVKLCGISDSAAGVSHTIETDRWQANTFVDQTAAKNITYELNGQTVTAEYVMSMSNIAEAYTRRQYKCENADFTIDADDRLATYFPKDPVLNDNVLSEAECIDIANRFVSGMVDVRDYQVSAVFNAQGQTYDVSYAKYINGILCADGATVRVYQCGVIYSFSSAMFGKMSCDLNPEYDLEGIKAQIISKISPDYENAKKKYDKIEFGDVDFVLTLDENDECVLIGRMSVGMFEKKGEYFTELLEALRFVVQ